MPCRKRTPDDWQGGVVEKSHIPVASDSGFSLVETIAALAILALAALPLILTATNTASATRRLEHRMLARTVAENLMAFELVRPDLVPAGEQSGVSVQMSVPFDWTVVSGPAVAGGLQNIDVQVRYANQPEVLFRLNGLRAVPYGLMPDRVVP